MADAHTTVHIGENSPRQAAYKLSIDVMSAENKGPSNSDRAYSLKLY